MTLLPALVLLAQADWKRIDLEGISLELPAAPRQVFHEGAPASVRNWVVASREAGVGVSLQPFDDIRSADANLANDLSAFLSRYHGQIVAQSDVVLNGWPGLDATLRIQELGDIRFVAYQTDRGLVIVTAGGDGPDSANLGKRVVQSLKLSEAFGTGPQKTPGPTWTRVTYEPAGVSGEFPKALRGTMPMASATSPIQARAWYAQYGNRSYRMMFMTPLKKAETEPTPESRWRSIQSLNASALKGMKAKILNRKESILAGERSERVEAEGPEGEFFVVVETADKGDWKLHAVATVPKALKNSPEVAHFFGSFRSAKD